MKNYCFPTRLRLGLGSVVAETYRYSSLSFSFSTLVQSVVLHSITEMRYNSFVLGICVFSVKSVPAPLNAYTALQLCSDYGLLPFL